MVTSCCRGRIFRGVSTRSSTPAWVRRSRMSGPPAGCLSHAPIELFAVSGLSLAMMRPLFGGGASARPTARSIYSAHAENSTEGEESAVTEPDSPSPRRRGRPPTIDRAGIVAAARRLDPKTLTLQAVADDLGVQRQSLSYHVADR